MRCAGNQRALAVLASKLWTSVRNDFQGKTMIAEHMLNEQVSPSLCSAFYCSGDNVYMFGQSVNKDKNSIMARLGLSKTSEKSVKTLLQGPCGRYKGCNRPDGLTSERLLR